MSSKYLLPILTVCLGALGCARLSSLPVTLTAPLEPAASLAVPTTTIGRGPANFLLGVTLRDVEFCSPGGLSLAMDLYFPARADRAVPVVVFVHGGGWTSGDKRAGAGIAAPELVQRGYLVASINYRLAPEHSFPANIEDVKCAVRFLRAQAADLGIDPARIGAYGTSAGGHLVSLLGLAGPEAGFDGDGGWEEESSAVQAVVNLYGPTDLAAVCDQAQFGIVFRAADCQSPALTRASPVTYVHAGAPPFLIIQGTEDELVPVDQARILSDRLTAAGAPVTLLLVEHAGHGLRAVGGVQNPSREEVIQRIADFFDAALR